MRFINSLDLMSRSAARLGRSTTHLLFPPASRRLRLRVLLIELCLVSAVALYWLAQPPQTAQAFSNTIVISQVYAGGGTTGAPYNRDFIELYNRGTTTVSLTGWSVQYANATNTTWTVKTLSGSIAPGKYYLIQGGSTNTSVGASLPTGDATGGPNMVATTGKVALVSTTTALDVSSGCPFRADVVDFVGYGTSADCSEGSPTANTGNTTAAIRKGHSGNAYQETDNNSNDFLITTPMPRNGASSGTTNGSVLISEFRLRGPNGANDEFFDIYNNTDSDMPVLDISVNCLTLPQGCGWALVDIVDTNNPRFVIPNGTLLKARSHYLAVNGGTGGYSLSTYATANQTYSPPTSDPDWTGVSLFKTADPAQFNTTNLWDSVGFYGINEATPVATRLYREGNGLSSNGGITANSEFSFVRKISVATALPQDTGDNAADFVLVNTAAGTLSTNGTVFTTLTALLGAPGPERGEDVDMPGSGSPITRNITNTGTGFGTSLVDPNCGTGAAPNQARATTSFGDTLKIRRKYTNNTGSTISRLRFRIVDITTLNSHNLYSGAAQADVRAVTSPLETVTLACSGGASQDVQGLTLEYADGTNKPDQSTNFGGLNSTVAAGSLSGGVITLTTPLADGDSIYVNFWVKIVSGGKFRFFYILEAGESSLPNGN